MFITDNEWRPEISYVIFILRVIKITTDFAGPNPYIFQSMCYNETCSKSH